MTTVLGGLGAIFTPASTARALSGAAGITSGVAAEFQEAYFRSLTMEVIVEGIEERRSSIYNEIINRRLGFVERKDDDRPEKAANQAVSGSQFGGQDQGSRSSTGASQAMPLTLSQYSIERAVQDAIRYHQACSVIEGIRAAGDAVRQIRHPGPELLKHAVNQAGAVRQALNDAIAGTTPSAAVTAAEARQLRGISSVPIAVPLEEIERSPLVGLADAEREAAQLDADMQVLGAATRASVAEAKRRTPQQDSDLSSKLSNIETEVNSLIQNFRGFIGEYSNKINVLRNEATMVNSGVSLSDRLAKARSDLEAAARESESMRAQKRAQYDLVVNDVRDQIGEPARRNRDLLIEANQRARQVLSQVRDGSGGTSASLDALITVVRGVKTHIDDRKVKLTSAP